MSADPRASLRNPRIFSTLLLVFLCGSLAGALVMRHGFATKPQGPGAYWTKGGKEIAVEHFVAELDLTPEQAVEIEMILDDFTLYYETLQSQLDEVRANGKGRIMRMLNPEQQDRFERMLREAPVREAH